MINYSEKEIEYIASKDPIMNNLVEHFGYLSIDSTSDVYLSLVQHIIGQLLSNNAAKSLNERFLHYFGDITPERLSNSSIQEIRSCGLSRQKATAIFELSVGIMENKYVFDNLASFTDDEVIEYLMKIKGVGRWTAEMVTEFTLGRLNIFCYQDVALKNGIIKAHNFDKLDELTFNELKRKYSPYCSVASLYYYALNDE